MSDSQNFNYLAAFGPNAGFITELYQLFREDPSLVSPEWASFFAANQQYISNGCHPAPQTPQDASDSKATTSDRSFGAYKMQVTSERAINAFRSWGHLNAKLSPITAGGMAPQVVNELNFSSYLSEIESKTELGSAPSAMTPSAITLGAITLGSMPIRSLDELLNTLSSIYCGSVGYEFEHIPSLDERNWLRERIEGARQPKNAFSSDERREFLKVLVRTGVLESELHRKYVGAKWFSVDGNDSLMPAIKRILDLSADNGVSEVIFGMAHRGRINVLVNSLGMPLERLFAEFEDRSVATVVGAGDVKYHLGWQSEHERNGKRVKLELLPNPSHLEFVNAVVEGVARAKQDLIYDRRRSSVLPVLLHGDAAFAGQGIVFECINYAGLEGYTTGGSLHIVINNQIGFTTTPDEGRSTRYCSDLAKGLGIPVFHVNAEDPDAACFVAELALDYRNTFGKDVIIDLIGHRKYGHNESDDPSFTQPLTYQELKGKSPIWQQYGERLAAEGVIASSDMQGLVDEYKGLFAQAQERPYSGAAGAASPVHGRIQPKVVKTAVSGEALREFARGLIAYPEGFVPHPKLAKILQKRVECVQAGADIEWGVAEALAFAALVKDGGVAIRLSGQDCRRGTFSHRHLVLDDYEKAECWSPLADLAASLKNGSSFEVYNSSLSESGVLGYEFGYAAAAPRSLTMWEAQFGDFSNGAQCIIDQFISSSEAKWGQLSGVTLLLPHGFEGQGPEHSSARLERYLQLCAEGNMSVCYPSNAAQYFHLIRRQGLRELKRPLIVMTPKSLLRLPAATCTLEHLSTGDFNPLIVELLDPAAKRAKGVEQTVVLMSGKVYYDVVAGLKAADIKSLANITLARIEELYPFPELELLNVLAGAEGAAKKKQRVIWVQEEPRNQGAWSYVEARLRALDVGDVSYVGRGEAAATATGSSKYHALEQRRIVSDLVRMIG